jgi:hypothetical protein
LAAPVVTIKETAGAMRPSVVPLSQLPAAVVSAMTGGEGIVIDLSPADLGRLRIELPATAGAVEVRLVVEQPDTLMLVRTAAETLAEDLRQAGIMAQTVTVELLAAERGDPARVDVPRPEPGGGVQNGMAAASGQDRPGSASPDSGAGFQRGPGGGPGRDGGPSEAAESRPPVIAERLDLRL